MGVELPKVQPCRSCGAPVRWVHSARGVWMPIDAEPCSNGNLELHEEGAAQMIVARVVGKGFWLERIRRECQAYLSHHATCPEGRQWRRKREASRGAV